MRRAHEWLFAKGDLVRLVKARHPWTKRYEGLVARIIIVEPTNSNEDYWIEFGTAGAAGRTGSAQDWQLEPIDDSDNRISEETEKLVFNPKKVREPA